MVATIERTENQARRTFGILVDRALLAATVFAGKKSAHREILENVSINGNHAYAADGYRAVAVELPKGSEQPAEPINVKAAGLAAAIKRFGRVNKLPELELIGNGRGYGWLRANDGSADMQQLEQSQSGCTYPDVESLFPRDEPIAVVSFNARMMAESLAAFAAAGITADRVTMELHGEYRGIVLRAVLDDSQADQLEGRAMRAVVMPMVAPKPLYHIPGR